MQKGKVETMIKLISEIFLYFEMKKEEKHLRQLNADGKVEKQLLTFQARYDIMYM